MAQELPDKTFLFDGEIIKQEREHRQGEKRPRRPGDKGELLKKTGLNGIVLYELITGWNGV